MADQHNTERRIKGPSSVDAIVPLVTLAVLIGGSVFLLGTSAINGPLQIALMFCSVITSIIILKNGHAWDEIVKAEQRAASSVITPIVILLAVGALIGAWTLSGTTANLWHTMAFNCCQPRYLFLVTAVTLRPDIAWYRKFLVDCWDDWHGTGYGIATLAGVSPAITAGAVIFRCLSRR